ncbi:uncharacterized protein [Physcomitrium patens]|uniref:Uncharacterized protein n=1 Tax=Physcomitrium patens TaxID=3218 RepID=A9T9U0_PHYPA|nr:uncharacterized protein LOC112281719 [Physcomitrium patens]XP_024374324.1 uncharacterized protein LOC112281719 [Physcomitrium patens]PNR55106.1 hypothetical protein PHYPA_005999 [Physcomitrium patens]|eukprot:XP_024374323.1 uncharacterized protein LOC112281719 [Physcomitrella patens]
MEKHSEVQTNRDLLLLERESNPLENRLRVVQQSSGDAKPRMPTTSVPESSVIGRLKAFLPVMQEANEKLFSGIEEKGREEFDIEVVDEDDTKPQILMDLALGIADLNTPEAIAAAERAAAGQVHISSQLTDTPDDSSDDDMESDHVAHAAAPSHRPKSSKAKIVEK